MREFELRLSAGDADENGLRLTNWRLLSALTGLLEARNLRMLSAFHVRNYDSRVQRFLASVVRRNSTALQSFVADVALLSESCLDHLARCSNLTRLSLFGTSLLAEPLAHLTPLFSAQS